MEKWAVLLLMVGTLLLAACHHPRYAHRHYPVHSEIVVHKPPPLKVVVRPTAPSAHHVWIGGHWKRKRHGWVWIPGHWRRG